MRTRILFLVVLAGCLVASIVFAGKWQRAERRADETARWTRFVMDSLDTTLTFPFPPVQPWGRDTTYWQWVATSAQMQSRRWKLEVQNWARGRGTMLDSYDVEGLRTQGVSNPAAQFRESLSAHPELIPYKAVLGGTMQFERVVVLRPPFVFAEFEDGHIGGAMLLEYEVLGQGSISWKRLWSRLD